MVTFQKFFTAGFAVLSLALINSKLAVSAPVIEGAAVRGSPHRTRVYFVGA